MHDSDGHDCAWGLVAVKRPWVPEWLFRGFKWVIPYQPFTWIFTTPVTPDTRV